ncbi:MAG: cysteine-rich KTR domain-containing protein [Roseburia sp.]|nr:cysteine-rich KTR domain-containing protein [Roseburia sp.]
MLRVRDDTVLLNFPGYCKRCKSESLINLEPEPRAKSQLVRS